MTLKVKIWIALFLAGVLLTVAAGYRAYFPGEVAVTRYVQSVAPGSAGWTKAISSTAKAPWNLALLAITIGLSWFVAGWRGVLLAPASFAGMWLLGKWLGPVISRPAIRPIWFMLRKSLAGIHFP